MKSKDLLVTALLVLLGLAVANWLGFNLFQDSTAPAAQVQQPIIATAPAPPPVEVVVVIPTAVPVQAQEAQVADNREVVQQSEAPVVQGVGDVNAEPGSKVTIVQGANPEAAANVAGGAEIDQAQVVAPPAPTSAPTWSLTRQQIELHSDCSLRGETCSYWTANFTITGPRLFTSESVEGWVPQGYLKLKPEWWKSAGGSINAAEIGQWLDTSQQMQDRFDLTYWLKVTPEELSAAKAAGLPCLAQGPGACQ